MDSRTDTSIVPSERIERAIVLVRGERVLLDRDLARLYGVSTGILNRAVARNLSRFPPDFMFQLTAEEFGDLMRQFGASSWGGRRKLPRAFTEQGVAMLSSVLRSGRAVHVNIEIMRAFVRLRRVLSSNADLARKLDELETTCDKQFAIVFDAIHQLMAPPPEQEEPRPPIGFTAHEPHVPYRRRPRKSNSALP